MSKVRLHVLTELAAADQPTAGHETYLGGSYPTARKDVIGDRQVLAEPRRNTANGRSAQRLRVASENTIWLGRKAANSSLSLRVADSSL